MIKYAKIILSILGGFFVLLASAQSLSFAADPVVVNPATATPVVIPTSSIAFEPLADIDELPFQDNHELYQFDDPSSVVTIYVTVRKGNPAENTNYTWAEVNAFDKWIYGSDSADLVVGKTEALVQFGDESGPLPGELGYGEKVPNATIQIRGASTSEMPQKSYKIELFPGAGSWRGQSTIALNKHVFDFTRIRNKLNYDLMKQIPGLVSLRTQFVHLYVKDETVSEPGQNFVDYGLFTQVEQINGQFLENHQFDPNGQLYKATSFEFYRYEDELRLANDPRYNEAAFSNILEIKFDAKDHSKLIQMLEDVNNNSLPIEQTLEKYFDLENYFTWMAYNILIGSVDTQTQNFYLYSPLNSNKWYFLPWDYDDALTRQHREKFEYPYQRWETGIANYWGVVLHNRVLRSAKYREMLDDKINQLMMFLTPERIDSMMQVYRPVVEPYIYRVPDSAYIEHPEYFGWHYELIPTEVKNNYALYLESLEQPMPFFLGIPTRANDSLQFIWDESYDFDAENITYRFEVSSDPEFSNIVYQTDTINVTSVDTELFDPGDYFWRVIATNESGKTQYPFDAYFIEKGPPYDGMKYFNITADGEIIE
jgi:spore coat protein H